MAERLPPELSRLGDALASAAERRLAASRRRAERRRRWAATIVVGALAFAALTPAALGPAQRQAGLALDAEAGFQPAGCDQPHGARFTILASCEMTVVLDRRYAWR
jgi:hypothetical protein